MNQLATSDIAAPESVTPARPTPWPRWAIALAVLFVLIGIALRLIRWWAGRNFWLDECFLAMNLMSRSYGALAKPLDYNQGAPLGFLWLVKFCMGIFGQSERAMRIVPLISSCMALVLMALVSRRMLAWPAALLATALLAILEPQIYFASELKQYSTDVVIGLALVIAGLRTWERPESLWRCVTLALVGAFGIWFSHPAIFIAAAVGLTLGFSALLEVRSAKRALAVNNDFAPPSIAATNRRYEKILRFALIFVVWIASFAISYFLVLKPLAANPALDKYWGREGFMPLNLQTPLWIAMAIGNAMSEPGGFQVRALAGLAMAGGALAMWRGRLRELAMLGGPLVLALVASAARKYPFSERLLLFFTPAMVILVCAGLQWLWEGTQGTRRVVIALFAFALVVPALASTAKTTRHPPGREEILPALQYVAAHWSPDDQIVLYYHAGTGFNFYRDRAGISPQAAPFVIAKDRNKWNEYYDDLSTMHGPRVWIVFSHIWLNYGVNEKTLITRYLDHAGRHLDQFESEGAGVYLYDLSGQPPSPATRPTAQ